MVHAIKTFIVSLESVAVLCAVLVGVWLPTWWIKLDPWILGLTEWWWITPLGAAVVTSTACVKSILFPSEYGRILAKFPRYGDLRVTAVAGVIWVFIGVVLVTAAKVRAASFGPGIVSMLVVSGAAVMAIAVFSMFYASLKVRGLLLEYDDTD